MPVPTTTPVPSKTGPDAAQRLHRAGIVDVDLRADDPRVAVEHVLDVRYRRVFHGVQQIGRSRRVPVVAGQGRPAAVVEVEIGSQALFPAFQHLEHRLVDGRFVPSLGPQPHFVHEAMEALADANDAGRTFAGERRAVVDVLHGSGLVPV
jgi:hypothetical protein